MKHWEAERTPPATARRATIPLPEFGPRATHTVELHREPAILLTPPAPIPHPAPSGTLGQPDSRLSTPSPAAPRPQWKVPTIPWWDKEQLILRALASSGGLSILIGAVLLVIRFPELFSFTPPVRVMLASVLGLLLLALAVWLRRKQAHSTVVGAPFVASAGILSSMPLISTFYYTWVAEWLCLLLLLVVIACYLALSRRWSEQYFALLVGCIFALAALVFNSSSSIGFWLPGALAGIGLVFVSRGNNWRTAQWTGGLLSLFGILFGDRLAMSLDAVHPMQFGNGIAAAIALVCITHLDRAISRPIYVINGLIVASAMLATLAASAANATQSWICVALAGAWVAFGHLKEKLATYYCTTVALVWLPVLFIGVVLNASETSIIKGHMVPWVFLLVFAAAIAWVSEQREHWSVWAAWSLVSLYMVSPMHSSVLLKRPLWLTSANSVTIAILLFVVLAVGFMHRRAILRLPNWAALLIALLGLHYSTLGVVTTTTFIGAAIGGDPTMWLGYLIGHALISISWIAASGWILLGHTKLSSRAALGVGITLSIAGTVKLVFFDMATLTGVPRIAAFLISGIVLFIIATRRGKMLDNAHGPVGSPTPQPTGEPHTSTPRERT
ncbi:hypothetical protein [Corynebacterium sp.]|uniref:DUF2339 domain-containing protein n=1 Tax=Corynebacterium sp. TaxID=1720 RepID=UPI0026DAE67E|nr:hypothetical protein [Corynebacterium sp.]MDO5077936.1 hypothetical protein [Corynebacterium sp.]